MSNEKVNNDYNSRNEFLSLKCAVFIPVLLAFALNFVAAKPVLAADEEDAESDTFFGADVVYNNLNIEAADTVFNPLTLRLRLGINIFRDIIPSIALESHFAFDITEDEQDVNGQNAAIRIDHAVSLLARPYFELSDIVVLYGLVGFSSVQVQGDTNIMGDDTDSGFSIGAGAQFALPFDVNGNIEAIQLITGDKVDLFALSFGISVPL